MTEISAEQTTSTENELLDEIERRQDEVLAQLDTLNTQLEQVLKLHSAPPEQPVADETNREGGQAEHATFQQSPTVEAAGETIAKEDEEATTAEAMPAEAPTAMPAIQTPTEAPVEHAGPLMIVPVPEIAVPENGASPSAS